MTDPEFVQHHIYDLKSLLHPIKKQTLVQTLFKEATNSVRNANRCRPDLTHSNELTDDIRLRGPLQFRYSTPL